MGALDVSKGTVKSIYALGAKLGMVERGGGHADALHALVQGLLLALAGGMDRMALCSSINYLADSGYLQVRCIEDKAPSSVSDAELEDLEVKLTPRGIQLQRCVKKDPLVDM